MNEKNETLDNEVDVEKEARINALKQLLANTQADVVRAFEGEASPEEYEALRTTRQAWKKELAELQGEPVDSAEKHTPNVLQAAVATQALLDDILGVGGNEDE